MDLNNYLYAALLLLGFAGYYLNFGKNSGTTPATVICFFWGIATLMTYLKLQTDLLDSFYNINGYGVAPYIFPFAVCTVVGFTTANIFCGKIDFQTDQPKRDALYQETDKFCKNLYFILYVSLFFALLRFFSLGTASLSLASIRGAYIEARFGNLLYTWTTRLYFYSNFLSLFLLAALGIKYGLSRLDMKAVWKVFLLYCLAGIAVAGRNFLANFIFYFGFPFFIVKGERFFHVWHKKSEYRKIITLGLVIVFLFILIALGREISSYSQESYEAPAWQKLFYCSDGILFTDYLLNSNLISKTNDGYLMSFTFVTSPPPGVLSQIKETRMSVWVQSILPDLFFNFGITNTKYIWGILCFFLQIIVIYLYRTEHLWGCISAATLTACCAQTIMMNSFSNIYVYFIFLILAFLISQTRNKLGQRKIKNNIPKDQAIEEEK